MSTPDGVVVTCSTLFDFGEADIISLIKDADSYSPGAAVSVGQFALYSKLHLM